MPSPTTETGEKTPAATTKNGKKIVRYVGTADVRKISKAQFASIDVESDAVIFSAKNGFKMSDSDLSADALRYFDEVDDDFVVEDAKG